MLGTRSANKVLSLKRRWDLEMTRPKMWV